MVIYKEEVAKVFALYLGCECRLEDGQVSDKTTMISADGCLMVDYNGIGDTEHDIECCQLILTPLSKITDEHKLAIYAMGYTEVKKYMMEILPIYEWKNTRADQHQQLIIWGYAVPLWFGINHWANGKTAIELKMAIEK
jgi:hypothetical protein